MYKVLLVLLTVLFFNQAIHAQKNKNLKTYSIGDYQLEINIPKRWDPMSERKKEEIAKENELIRRNQDTVDLDPMITFEMLEKGILANLICEYAIVDSVQKTQVQLRYDKFLERTCNDLKTLYPDLIYKTSETKLSVGALSYRVFNIEIVISKNISVQMKYYCTFLENIVVGLAATTLNDEDQNEILTSIKGATFRQMANKDMATMMPQADIKSIDQKPTKSRNVEGPRESFKFNGQNLNFVLHVPYKKTKAQDYQKDKSTKDKERYSKNVFNYEGIMGIYFKCNAHVFLPADTATDANYFLNIFKETLAEDPIVFSETPPKFERQDLIINGLDFCLGKVTFETNLAKVYSYTYYTKVETTIYEFTFLTFNEGDLVALDQTMLSMIIESSSKKKKNPK